MEKLVGEGLVRSIGVSNFNSHQLARVLQEGEVRPVVNQIEVHPYLTNHDLVDFCRQNKVVVTAFSPFASPDRSWFVTMSLCLLNCCCEINFKKSSSCFKKTILNMAVKTC